MLGKLKKAFGPNPKKLGEELAFEASREHRDFQRIHTLLDRGADPNVMDEVGAYPLYWMASDGYFALVKKMLANGADPNLPNQNSVTPLIAAIYGGYTEIVKLLVEAGADLSLKISTGHNAIDCAKKMNKPAITAYFESVLEKQKQEQDAAEKLAAEEKKKAADAFLQDQVTLKNDIKPVRPFKIK